MSAEDESDEKEFEATEQKLQEQRRKGEVPKSTDLNTAAAFFGLLVAGMALGWFSLIQIADLGMVLLGQSDRLAPLVSQRATPLVGGMIGTVALGILPLLLIPMLMVIATLLAQRALIFAPEKLKPKASRISIISNAKNKFGRSGLFEFAKSAVKLIIISTVLWLFLIANMELIVGSLYLSPAVAVAEMLSLMLRFLALVFVVKLLIGVVDFFWQRAEHLRRNRMSHKEMRDEMKNSEGDPHAKSERRRRGRQIASNHMLDAVADANVVIVNPTHYAVALKWSPIDRHAPICVAKGVDEIAARIREKAAEAGVPLHSDPVTARALHASVDLGAEIRPEHYAAVAAAIRFADTIRARIRKGRWA